jgi:hypothetical protein
MEREKPMPKIQKFDGFIQSHKSINRNAWEREKTMSAHMNEVMKACGFTVDHTGGGCLAYALHSSDGFYLWITDLDGVSLPEAEDAPCNWGVYDPKGDTNWLAQGDGDTVAIVRAYRDALLSMGRQIHGRGDAEALNA